MASPAGFGDFATLLQIIEAGFFAEYPFGKPCAGEYLLERRAFGKMLQMQPAALDDVSRIVFRGTDAYIRPVFRGDATDKKAYWCAKNWCWELMLPTGQRVVFPHTDLVKHFS